VMLPPPTRPMWVVMESFQFSVLSKRGRIVGFVIFSK
jgi:hypothetical protein